MTYEEILAELTDTTIERQMRCEISPEMEFNAIVDMFYCCENAVELKAMGVRLKNDKLIPQAIKDQCRPEYVRRLKQLRLTPSISLGETKRRIEKPNTSL